MMQGRRSALALLAVASLTAGCAVSRQSPRLAGRAPALSVLSTAAVEEAQFIVRVAPGAVVTITAPTTNPTFLDSGSNVITTITGTATAQAAITGCTWVNRATGASGSATGTNTWSIPSVPLIVGTNSIAVTCLTLLGGQGTAVLTVARPQPPAPTVTITAPTASPTYDAGSASSITVSGTASTLDTIPSCTWTNSLGGSGTASGTASWSETVPLTVGTNVITESCPDSLGQPGTDVITITRSAGGAVANPIDVVRMPSTSATLPDSVWAAAGVQGGIPSATWANCNNTNCNAIAPGGVGTVSATTVNAAISGAQVGGVACSASVPCVVRIRAGSFTFSSGLNLTNSGVVVRGAGPSQTFLDINGTSNGCGYGTWAPAVSICEGGGFGDTPDVTWSAGFAKGTSVVTLPDCSSITAGLTPIFLNQLNDTPPGFPASGDLVMCDSGGTCNTSGGGGGSGFPAGVGVSGRAASHGALVTACSSGAVTIDPPLSFPNYRAGKTAQAHFAKVGTRNWLGLEDLSIDQTDAGNTGILLMNTTNAWVENVRLINTGGAQFGLVLGRSVHVAVTSNYVYRSNSSVTVNYAVDVIGVGSLLLDNNIFQGQGSAITSDNGWANSVVANNFFPGGDGPCVIRHLAGEHNILTEGNICKSMWIDNADGAGCCFTFFRNGLSGAYSSGLGSGAPSAFEFESNTRLHNVVGNVITGGGGQWTTYQGSTPAFGCGDATLLYDLGSPGCAEGSRLTSFDTNVSRLLLRWFNWDWVTSSADNTSGDQTGTRCVSGEVPTSVANFANALPGTCGAPNSLYLSAKPAYWPVALAWPAIGPDISGGTITNTGGHIRLNAAADKYLNTMGGPASGSGGPLTFVGW